VLITSLCSLSGLSERVRYGDCATGCKIRVLDPSRDVRFFSSLKCSDGLWDHPASYSKGMGIVSWGGRGMDLTTLLHLVVRVKNEWSCTSASPLCLCGMDKTTFLKQDSTVESRNKPCL